MIKALKAFCLALSRLSCSVSLLICSLSFLTRKISLSSCFIRHSCCSLRCSKSGSRRQFSNCCAEAFGYDKNCRHRGSDASDSPLLLEVDGAADDGDVVIGGEQGDQAENKATDGLGEAETVEAEPPEAGPEPSG
ncbi:MAG: hypothetical protein ACO3B3_11700 [Cyanobium sp.]